MTPTAGRQGALGRSRKTGTPKSRERQVQHGWWYITLLSLLAGVVTALAFAPLNMVPLALLGPALLYLAQHGQSTRATTWSGWMFGIGFFGAGVSWVFVSIHVYGAASVPLAGLMTAVFVMGLALLFALQGWLFGRLCRSASWLGFVGLWFLFEWVRSWLFTGFPWLFLGYIWVDTPFSHLAAWGGVWALTLFTLFLSIGLAEAIRSRSWPSLLPVFLLPVLVFYLPTEQTQARDQAPLRVALVQPDIPQMIKWEGSQLESLLQHQMQLTRQHPDVQLVLWPETAIPAFYYEAAPYIDDFLEELDQQNIALISGFPFIAENPRDRSRSIFHNSLGVFSHGSGIYHKQRLVPFGEYVPLENQLRGLIEFFDLPMSSFSLPSNTELRLYAAGHHLASTICYEIAYPELVRKAAINSDLLLTVSNDAWFGNSFAPDQHLQIARMRAIENGRWLIRGTNNGITAIIRDDGSIDKQAPRQQAAVITGSVPAMQGTTLYQQLGVWPSLLLSLLLLGIAAFRTRV